ncbi:hypothetical protein [Nonomuraea sp. 10N515B]|uniref:hypothetical protein n=1 Tax=Nonomuraea sp. 10N515B TaxID=3457422 RepID=UPI003FCCC475
MATIRETRIAQETVSSIDYMSRLLGAIEGGNWVYAADKLRQLRGSLDNLDKELRCKGLAHGAAVEAYVVEHAQDYRIGRALYGEAARPTSPKEEVEIPLEVAAHVLFHFGRGGWPPSGFKATLMLAIAQADVVGRGRLALGFPEYVAAFNMAQLTDDGTAKLQAIVGGE